MERPGKYIADGIDVASIDENGETDVLEDALLVIRSDYKAPGLGDLENFYTFISKLNMFDYDTFRKGSKPVEVSLNTGQLQVIRERNEW
ncbi:hypothetical protein [Gracilibacillus xinjiangensis]|uniref:Uncharacterized protein n=1 Tax=Gracilibacillus xinjiangensis TaxID=1193282 RepID=A0ABV8WWC8_9BACI